MADNVSLSGAVRANLLTLQLTQRQIDTTQGRLSTGLRVNLALDDASAFFAAQSLNSRASDLDGLKSDIDQGISSLEAAINGIEAITELAEQARGLAITAKATSDTNERSSLAVQFDALLSQIDAVTNDTSFAGTNLLQATPDNLTVNFNEDGTSALTISGIDSTTGTGGINVAGAVTNFAADTNIDLAITAVNTALTTLRTSASTLGSNAAVLTTRLDFTESLANTLEGGASKLTQADLNEESANLLALQTRQQLGINSLSLAAQSERSILALFG
ncbi:MAG: flagellin [Alphaproteobacteria bacterium]|nr:flagellin [Alphaproteobacteria bacterium]